MMKSLYDLFMIPLEKRGISNARKHLVPKAKGTVLEIGAGTGANVLLYNKEKVNSLILSDKVLSKTVKKLTLEHFKLVELDVEDLPFENETFDYVVHTLVFCSVTNVHQGLNEIHRVLKNDGRLLFIEHIMPEKKKLKNLFSFINPAWKIIASGCNLTRDFEKSLIQNGFEIIESSKFMNTVFVYGEAKKHS